MRRVFVVLLATVLLLMPAAAGMGEARGGAAATLDVEFAMAVTQSLSELGDNPDVGNRSSGSQAEKQAADLIREAMEDIGLQSVTVDKFTADNWSFNRGRVYYTDASGERQWLPLGGFATNLTREMEPVRVVYAGRGTAADYEGLDVEGKAVLIDIDQAEDWWIGVPAYEAHVHGALCVLAVNVSGYAYYDADTIGSQDICGPDFAPAFSLSQNSAAILRDLISAGEGEAEIILDVESVVTLDGESQNVWGEIPGKTEEAIYLIAHYDGYYHSYFDDASGVGSMLAIAKALVESGYTPDKTLRFVAHGAEEWGDSDTEYDWGVGAFKQITEVRPEWAESAFAILNLDGMYPVQGHTDFQVAATYELAAFAEEHGPALYEGSGYGLQVTAPTGCWTEDFSYVLAGVPSIVASYAEPYDLYHGAAYHSNMDNVALGVDEAAWRHMLELFLTYAMELDRLACRPMDFSARMLALEESYSGEARIDFEALSAAANALGETISQLNADYAEALAAGDRQTAAKLRERGLALDRETHELFGFVADKTIAFDWDDNVVFPFEVTQANIAALEGALACLEEGDAALALEEYLFAVDYNWHAYDFSRETYEYVLDKMYFKAEGTWGEGRIRCPGENLWEVIHLLMDKAEAEEGDFSGEISSLQESLKRQYDYVGALNDQLAEDLQFVLARLEAIQREFAMEF